MDRLATLLTLVRDKPNDPFLIFAIALEHKSSGNEGESMAYFERLVNEFPDYVPTYYQYGKLMEETGQTQKAMHLYKIGIKKATETGDNKTARELQQAIDMINEA